MLLENKQFFIKRELGIGEWGNGGMGKWGNGEMGNCVY